MKIEFIPVTDYAATVESLVARKLDMVWYGGFTFIQAKIRSKGAVIPLVQRAEDEKFQSVFITQPDSGINSLADLKGKTFTFGSQSSTSGHLMPRAFLLQNGIDPDKTFRRIAFSGAHDATALQVAGGKVDAGALNISVYNKMIEDKKLDASQIKVFYTTPPYFDYNWTVRGDLDPVVVKKLREAFLALDPSIPEHKEILALQRASKFIPCLSGWLPKQDLGAKFCGWIHAASQRHSPNSRRYSRMTRPVPNIWSAFVGRKNFRAPSAWR